MSSGNDEAAIDAFRRCGDEVFSAAANLASQDPKSDEELLAEAAAWEEAARQPVSPECRAALLTRAATRLEPVAGRLAPGLEQKVLETRIQELRKTARKLLRDPEGKQRDDQLALWKPGVKVEGMRSRDDGGATLVGEIVTSDAQWLEIELTESWTVKQGKNKGARATPKHLWRFERIADDPRTGRVVFAVKGAKLLSPGNPNHRSNYGGTVTIRGTTMNGEYRFDWKNEDKVETPPLRDWSLELE